MIPTDEQPVQMMHARHEHEQLLQARHLTQISVLQKSKTCVAMLTCRQRERWSIFFASGPL
jgi:hypothetical protein